MSQLFLTGLRAVWSAILTAEKTFWLGYPGEHVSQLDNAGLHSEIEICCLFWKRADYVIGKCLRV